ncbi:hypothetical protein DMA15_19395 [Streptomyces sp. WAC 01529]|nr:hypothetical protein DMA15_19395 [Streptomyces sp. WAC 01529]
MEGRGRVAMEVRTKPAMCMGMLRSVLVGAFSVGLAVTAFSGLGVSSDYESTAVDVSTPDVRPLDIIWNSTPGDIIWDSGSKGAVRS